MRPRPIVAVVLSGLLLLAGCPGKPAAPSPGSPAAIAAEEDALCAQDLKEPGHLEAREWCKKSTSMGFEVSTDRMLELADLLYEHGATRVDVVGIEKLEDRELSACMVATLPTAKAARASFFAWYGPWSKETLGEEAADHGQTYARLALD